MMDSALHDHVGSGDEDVAIVFTPPTARQFATEEEIALENDRVYRFLLACKPELSRDTLRYNGDRDEQQQLHHQANMDLTYASTTSKSKPGKGSQEYLREVIEPRGIKIISDSHDPQAIARLHLQLGQPSDEVLAAKLKAALVTFDSSELMKACEFASAGFNEAQWTAEVYQKYFLLGNPVHEKMGVGRIVQHLFCWSGTSTNTCLPPALNFDRRTSGLFCYPKIWFPSDDSKNRSENSHRPDHCYVIFPEEQNQLHKYERLPAFRGGIFHKNLIISCPPYLITEEKASVSSEIEAQQYLAFVASFILHERLLLRRLTDKAQKDSEILIDDSLCVYAITNCGSLSNVYKTVIRERDQDLNDKPVRFDFVRVATFNLTLDDECNDFKRLVNLIHFWGSSIHMPTVMAEGLEALQSEYCLKGGWLNTLKRLGFYYTPAGLAFKTLEQDYLGADCRGLSTT